MHLQNLSSANCVCAERLNVESAEIQRLISHLNACEIDMANLTLSLTLAWQEASKGSRKRSGEALQEDRRGGAASDLVYIKSEKTGQPRPRVALRFSSTKVTVATAGTEAAPLEPMFGPTQAGDGQIVYRRGAAPPLFGLPRHANLSDVHVRPAL